MKKIISSALVVTLATILFSCQKQKDLALSTSGTASTKATFNELVPLPPDRVPFILSGWFSVTLNPDKDGGLYGSYELKNPLPGTTDTDVRLAYVRRPSTEIGTSDGSFSYNQLPAIFTTSDGYLANMTFELSTNLFEIFIRPIDIMATILVPDDFKDCAYRYIVISKVDYDGMHIDWSNYKKVATVLNFTP